MIWLIGIGGSLGASARYLLGVWIKRGNGFGKFPFSTLIINVSGSLLLGILAEQYMTNGIGMEVWYFAGVGFCGAYTTFSTFGYETLLLIQEKKIKLAIYYVLSSVAAGLIFAIIGFHL